MIGRVTFSLIVLAISPGILRAQAPHNYVPPGGIVPDSVTAVRIAEAVWSPIYGAATIEAERPFGAQLANGVWTVLGSLPKAPPGYETVGGVAEIEIAQKDGRVLRVSHGK